MDRLADLIISILNHWTMLVLALVVFGGSVLVYWKKERDTWRLAITFTYFLFVLFYLGRATRVLVSPYDLMSARVTILFLFLNAAASHRHIFLNGDLKPWLKRLRRLFRWSY